MEQNYLCKNVIPHRSLRLVEHRRILMISEICLNSVNINKTTYLKCRKTLDAIVPFAIRYWQFLAIEVIHTEVQ